jgi:hypothetical protein
MEDAKMYSQPSDIVQDAELLHRKLHEANRELV